ncbi:MAG: lamin tail domain-containing protein, partial [Candidatus Cloacimonadaceae bacterium]|nr:lamin tail domain-containing protein [Candidatus Cloacimonadaceae bacterium]
YSADTISAPEMASLAFWISAVDDDGDSSESNVYTIIIGHIYPTLYINEIMPSNISTITDNAGNYDDWIEIYNPNDYAIDIAGWHLVDDHIDDPTHTLHSIPYGFAEFTTVPANGFAIIWFDEQLDQGPLHINTKLGTAADAVYLIAPDGLTIIDSKAWTSTTGLGQDISLGRFPDGNENWQLFGDAFPYPVSPGDFNGPVDGNDPILAVLPPILAVYPNPARGTLHLHLQNSSKAPAEIRIYNLKGQMVSEFSVLEQQSWNTTDKHGKPLGTGIYFIQAKTGNTTLIKKICIIR